MKMSFTIAALLAATIAMPASAQAVSPADYVKQAGASDRYETESSKMVLQTTKDPKVRAFASMMVKDHATSTKEVKIAAAKSGVKAAPPMLTAAQADMVAQLRATSGPARDTAYIAQQKTAHDEALALHQGYAADGSAAPLKAAATKIVPVVSHHIEMLNAM